MAFLGQAMVCLDLLTVCRDQVKVAFVMGQVSWKKSRAWKEVKAEPHHEKPEHC
jgi:hypothetical protein